MEIKSEKHTWKIVSAVLFVIVAVLFIHNRTLAHKVDALEAEKETYALKESKSYIVERISNQMEEIAYQQKEISDQRREEAVHQMSIAEKMRVRAEEGENLAKKEQHKAQQYALHLEDARNVAEGERAKAVEQQKLAEAARNEADTLSRISLARSLASSSLIQYQSGNFDISGLLACEAWNLMTLYNGDVFHPILFDALSKNSESTLSRKIHKGGIIRILPVSKETSDYLSVSKYGEISRWKQDGNRLIQQHIFNDSTYSFRDVCLGQQNSIYALDFNGRLVIFKENQSRLDFVLPETKGWMRVCPLNDTVYLLVSTSHIYFFDTIKLQIVNSIEAPQSITAIGKKDTTWLAFGGKGKCWEIKPNATVKELPINVNETISSYAWSTDLHQTAIGTESGNIYLLDAHGSIIEKLVGHRSKVTQLEFGGHNLFSSSYDCSVNIWNLEAAKIEALSLMEGPSWIYCFALSSDNSIWIGDESGNVHRILYSPDDMVKLVKRNLKRDFTDDEWTYYLGKDISRKGLNIFDKK